jgi:DNA-binding HxlR family transcriptional regulator
MADRVEPKDIEGCCPFQEAIDLLSKRHAMTIIWLLQQESPRRFNDIKRTLDLNPVTLTQRLEDLVKAGIVSRRTFKETPPRVEYALTGKGQELIPLMDQLGSWARRHDIAGSSPPHTVATPVA